VGGLPGGASVTDTITVSTDAVNPAFGWQQDDTSVTVTADTSAPANQQFVAVPRVYLNPASGAGGVTATELRAATFASATELNGIVPSGLDLGSYDIIVVNPDGTVGLISDGFEVTQDATPIVETVEPGSWVKDTTTAFVGFGSDFRYDSGAVPNPVSIACDDGMGGVQTPASVTFDANNSTATEFAATVDTSGLGEFVICTVRFTNPDGTFFDFAPIVVTNPTTATNFFQFSFGPSLNVARRGPVVSSGVPSRRQRSVYVIGGDDGDPANALDSVEYGAIDRFGAPQSFDLMPRHALPTGGLARSKAIRVDDFVYAVGGYKGSAATTPGATGEIIRANVLDPLFVPEMTDVDFEVDTGGLSAGVYYYRVSAVLDAGSAYAPGSETLASEPLPVSVPASVDGTLVPTVFWQSFPGAVSYRVYRNETPNQPFGTEKLIGTINDTGAGTYELRDPATAPIADESPLPIGALGAWHVVGTGISPRHGHGLTVLEDPAAAGTHYVYAGGGEDDNGRLASIDMFTITVNGPRDQSVGSETLGVAQLSSARNDLRLAIADAETGRVLTSPPLLYAFGGRTAPNAHDHTVEHFAIGANGAPAATGTAVANQALNYSGYAGSGFNSAVILMGGFQGGVSRRSRWSPMAADGSMVLWDNFDARDYDDRYLAGAAPFVGFYYVAGGLDANGVSSATLYAVVGAASQ
jgi:hypothetical protein